jgi:hypothetical protein
VRRREWWILNSEPEIPWTPALERVDSPLPNDRSHALRLTGTARLASTLFILCMAGCGSPESTPADRPPVHVASAAPEALAPEASESETKASEPAPAECASCGDSQSHSLPELSRREFQEQLGRFASEPLEGGSPAMETLLFHNARSSEFLAESQDHGLDPEHLAFLKRELARDHAVVAIRIVDASGVERLSVKPTRVPLRVRQHLRSTRTQDVAPAVLSGTAVRVGLDRLWVRY